MSHVLVDDGYKLDAESPLAISQSLWDDFVPSEADSRSLFASTPTADVAGSLHLSSSVDRKDADGGRGLAFDCNVQDGSPRCKRRRMLSFSSSKAETNSSDQAFEPAIHESAFQSSGGPLLTGCEDFDIMSANSPWYMKSDDSNITLDAITAAPDKWMARCFDECLSRDHMKMEYDTSGKCGQDQETCEPEVLDGPVTPFSSGHYTTGRKSAARNKPKPALPVAYPFALVKPCGAQGDVTLNDINVRIAMPAPRPAAHYGFGESRPQPLSGAGLSGKSVVALTKIHTEGNGTITIMRTKG